MHSRSFPFQRCDRQGRQGGALVGVTMSIHKLTAGSGYDYLTRQVAAQDATDKGHTGLASYYAAEGRDPRAVGRVRDGRHRRPRRPATSSPPSRCRRCSAPVTTPSRSSDWTGSPGPDLTDRDYQAVTRLGAPYKVYSQRCQRVPDRGRPPDRRGWTSAAASVGSAPGTWPWFRRRSGLGSGPRWRPSSSAPSTAGTPRAGRTAPGRSPPRSRRHSRPRTTAVAGYDLTFSPVKSVSALWAVADPATAAAIERAHLAAVGDALRFLEEHALFTRTGTNGVRQVEVRGLVATAFTHRDSRAGDPDLHTHVAVANKVQTLDGRWLSIDGRVLFKANVSASETYNTALEKHLHAGLGLRFTERDDRATQPRQKPDVRSGSVRSVRWSGSTPA